MRKQSPHRVKWDGDSLTSSRFSPTAQWTTNAVCRFQSHPLLPVSIYFKVYSWRVAVAAVSSLAPVGDRSEGEAVSWTANVPALRHDTPSQKKHTPLLSHQEWVFFPPILNVFKCCCCFIFFFHHFGLIWGIIPDFLWGDGLIMRYFFNGLFLFFMYFEISVGWDVSQV